MRGPTEAEQLDARIREVRGLLGDLKRATRDANEAADRLEQAATTAARTTIEEVIETELARGLAQLQESVRKGADDAYDKVQAEVDRLMNLIRHGNGQGRGPDRLEQAALLAAGRNGRKGNGL